MSSSIRKPEPPEHLSPNAKMRWFVFWESVGHAPHIDTLDFDQVAAYCEAWAEWTWAKGVVLKEGRTVRDFKGDMQVSPYVSIRDDAFHLMEAILNNLGLKAMHRFKDGVYLIDRLAEYADMEAC